MIQQERFQDQGKVLSDFYSEVWVVCPACAKKALAKVNIETNTVRLYCLNCGYNKEISTKLSPNATIMMAAHDYFGASLWLQSSFKNDVFFAYNGAHLDYLERYISANLREHNDRSHFTLLEKLPKFYHEAKNRPRLLKIIAKLKLK